MVQEIPDKDREFLRLLPLLVHWVQKNKTLSDDELRAFIRQYPKHYDFAENTSVDNMLQMAEKYRNHGIYGKDIPVILSDEGKSWISEHFRRIQELDGLK